MVESTSKSAGKPTEIRKTWTQAEALTSISLLLNTTCGIPTEEVKADSRLVDDLNVDSLGMLEAIIEAEDAFGVSIDAGELSPSLTVQGLIEILASKGVIH